jgi:Ca-activated chloride channel family protein
MVAGSLIFAAPTWFWALLVIPLAGLGLWKLSVRIAKHRISKFYSAGFLPQILTGVNWRRKLVRFVATGVVLGLLAIALARPLTGPRSESDDRLGADLVIALDVSKSMWVEDVKPNRLEAVKKELSEWIMSQKSDRIGLVLFAGKAFVQAPLTHDYTALDFVLKDAGPKSVSKKGSNIPEAIETAAQMMNNNKIESKILLLISDGENLGGDAIAAARQARQNDGLTIYTIGVGTAAGGRVPSYDRLKYGPDSPEARQPHGQWIRSQYGAEVISRLDSQALRAMASVGGGQYFEFQPGESTFPNIRSKNISTLVERTRKIKTRDYDEWFQIPLALAMLVILFEPLLSRARRKEVCRETGVPVVKPVTFSDPAKPPVATVRVATKPGAVRKAAILLVALFAISQAAANVLSPTEEAEKLFAAGKADEAVAFLHQEVGKNPTDPYLSYNYGLALYRADRLDEANAVFQSVDALSADPNLRAQVLFQMGTIALKKGVELRKSGPQQNALGAVRAFEQALSNYQAQLQIRSSREAKENLKTTSEQLENVLLAIGTERTRANTEKTLREALQAYERATELNAKNQPLVDNAKKLLAKELERNAATADEAVDKAEAQEQQINEKTFKKLFEQREQIAAKLEEAVGLTPEDQKLEEALKEQQKDMSNLLTMAAKTQSADALNAETFFSNRHLKNLEDAAGKLDQAVALDAENHEAAQLGTEVKAKLENAYVANGDLALKHLRKSLEAEKAKQEAKDGANAAQQDAKRGADKGSKAAADAQLQDAISAADAYSNALGLAPDNQRARDGLAEVSALLPELYSKAGLNDLAKVESQMDGKLPAPGEGEGPSEEGQGAETAPGASPAAGNESGKASLSDLRGASATLEKAINNLTAAAGLKPDDARYQADLARAEKLMGAVRAELEKAQGVAAAGAPGPGEGPGEGEGGEGPGGSGEGKGQGQGRGQSSLQSMSQLRGKGGETGGGEGGDSKRYWDKFVQDW